MAWKERTKPMRKVRTKEVLPADDKRTRRRIRGLPLVRYTLPLQRARSVRHIYIGFQLKPGGPVDPAPRPRCEESLDRDADARSAR